MDPVPAPNPDPGSERREPKPGRFRAITRPGPYFRRGRSTDHRGRPVKLYGLPHEDFRDPSELPLEVRQRIGFRLADNERRLGRYAGIAVTAALLAVIAVAVLAGDYLANAANLSSEDLGYLAVYVLFAGIPLLIVLFIFTPRRESPLIRAFLAEGRCPSCAYDMKGIRRADDQLAACPECGAAWRMPRRHFAGT